MVTPDELFAAAEKFAAEANDEADYRVAIERAYYAAYHAANELEKSFPARSTCKRQGVGVHETLFLVLESPAPTLDYGLSIISQDIGAQLRMLRPFRVLATYRIQDSVTITDVEETMAGARDVVDECRKARSKLARPTKAAAA